LIHFYFLDKKFFSIFISGNIMIMYKDIFWL
jgi:hypothetical protein